MFKKSASSFIVVLMLLFSTTLFAQDPIFKWDTKKWQKGINAAATYSAEGQNYLVMSNPTNGNAWVFALTNDGKVGKMSWSKQGWPKGISAITTYKAEGQNYLVMSNPLNGDAWIFALGNDGKVGNHSLWNTKKWPKGISAITTYEAEGQNYLVMSNPLNGDAWIFTLGNDGKVGKTTWNTKKWPKGISAITTYEAEGQNYLVMSNPTNGNAWIYALGNDGKLGNHSLWNTKKWHKGISAINTFKSFGKNILMLYAPEVPKAWTFQLGSDGKMGQMTWGTAGWQKGISCFTDYEAEGISYEVLVNSTNGHAWIITRSPMISDIKIENFTGEESKQLVDNIDKTFNEIRKTNKRIKTLNEKAAGARKALGRTQTASKSINELNASVQRTYDAISLFTRIPVIGIPVKVLATSLNTVKGKLSKANKSVVKLEKSTLGPTLTSVQKLTEAIQTIKGSLTEVNHKLVTTKVNYGKATSCVTNSNDANTISMFESKSKVANGNLSTVNNSLSDINKSITELEKIANSISKLNNQLGPLEKQIKNIKKAFKESDKVAKEIDKVLSKRFKKQITVVKKKIGIDISLKKVLTGGKVGKRFKKFVDEWISKAIDPIIKKLKIKIPGVNIDGLKRELKNLNNSSKQLADQTNKVNKLNNNLKEMKNKLDSSFDDCLNVPPCKFNNDVDISKIVLVETDDVGARSDAIQEPVRTELTEKELTALLKRMEILTIEEYLESVSFAEFASANGNSDNKDLLANVLNGFEIDDKVQLITSMVRGATENKDDMATMTILDALAKIDFSQTNEVVEPFKDIVQLRIRDIEKNVKDGISKTYINKIITNLK